MHYLLIYELSPDYLARRGEFRKAHLDLAWEAADRGEIVLGGAVGDPAEGAILLFKADSPKPAKAFAKADPYVKNGLVRSWRVVQWSTAVGETAAVPLRLP